MKLAKAADRKQARTNRNGVIIDVRNSKGKDFYAMRIYTNTNTLIQCGYKHEIN
jgi:hypothetical protein